MQHIYTPGENGVQDVKYPSLLRTLYAINGLLKRDGIMAPTDSSFANTLKAYELIGRPLDRIKTIHVGGTNGKGSTSFKISECLHRSGIRTGLFVSPHLSSFRERVQINGELVSEEELERNLPHVLQLCADHSIPLTLFEITFIYACLQFEASGCQAVVLEVGVGGEVDATNVVDTALSIICSVSLDHTRILGATVEEIAMNKGGIFKRGVDALVGPGCPLAVLRDIAAQRGANLHTLSDMPFLSTATLSEDHVLVDTDGLNADLARAALHLLKTRGGLFSSLDIAGSTICDIMHTARPPCRWEEHDVSIVTPSGAQRSVRVILDVGHNPAAVGALMSRIKRDFVHRNVHLLYAMSRDKDVRTCLRSVVAALPYSHIHFVQSENFRALSKIALADIFRQETGEEIPDLEGLTPFYAPLYSEGQWSGVRECVGRLLALAASEAADSVLVVCGTGYVMPDARAEIGIVEPRDDVDLQRM